MDGGTASLSQGSGAVLYPEALSITQSWMAAQASLTDCGVSEGAKHSHEGQHSSGLIQSPSSQRLWSGSGLFWGFLLDFSLFLPSLHEYRTIPTQKGKRAGLVPITFQTKFKLTYQELAAPSVQHYTRERNKRSLVSGFHFGMSHLEITSISIRAGIQG